MKHIDAPIHVRGESLYVDDVPAPEGMLHAAIFGSPVAHAKIKSLDFSQALALEGCVKIFTHVDISGENQIGAIIEDEPALAIDDLHFIGHPIAVVVARSADIARQAARLCQVEYEVLKPIVHAREAHDKGLFIAPPRTFSIGDVENAWSDCYLIVEGECEIGGQEHLYLETNRTRAIPQDGNKIVLFSSTQSPYAVQKTAAKILGLPEHLVEVDVKRLGGGFGGKEDQATLWACLAALAAHDLKRPVELVLNRVDDMKMTGKRHPYSADFKIGIDKDYKIIAYDCEMFQNSGSAADLSTAVLERSLFHATNSYFIPNAKIYAACCRTNLHPHTAFRGFGGPQAMFVIESAISALAEKLDIDRSEIQHINLLKKGDPLPYGQCAEEDQAGKLWDAAIEGFDYAGRLEKVNAFNKNNFDIKKGLAFMPICFGISFTKTFFNQASALVHIYTDGSVSISTGGIEMGQGVSTNMMHFASRELGISLDRIRVESTNTTRIANMSPSAASATSDLNGNATILACTQIRERLFSFAASQLEGATKDNLELKDGYLFVAGTQSWSWEELVINAYLERIGLSAHGFYATPNVHFDTDEEKGRPFAYHVYGTALTEVTVDCLRGRYDIDWVGITHGLGRPINPVVDLGQIEGGLAQGIGWMTMEELAYNEDGKLTSHALSTYKAPDVFSAPKYDIQMIVDDNPVGPHGSKAVGEPPLMYGIGAFFAIRDAMRAFQKDADPENKSEFAFDAPLTPEKVLMDLHNDTMFAQRTTRDGPGETSLLFLNTKG